MIKKSKSRHFLIFLCVLFIGFPMKAQDFTQIKTYSQLDILVSDYLSRDQIDKAVEALEYGMTKFEEDLYSIISKLTLYYPKLNQYEKIMDAWEYGQSKGLFFPARYKRYESLFGTERYQKFILENDRLFSDAQKRTEAQYDIVLPASYSSSRKYPLFISLHGDNNNIISFKKRWKFNKLSNQYILAFFQSSQLSGTDRYVWTSDRVKGKKDLVKLYNQLISDYNIDESKVFIGGFSSGGALAIEVAIFDLIPISGFAVLCPAGIQIHEADLDKIIEAKNRNLKGYIISGEEDIFALKEQKKVAVLFDKAGLHYKMTAITGMGHTYPKDLDERLDIAFNFLDNRKQK